MLAWRRRLPPDGGLASPQQRDRKRSAPERRPSRNVQREAPSGRSGARANIGCFSSDRAISEYAEEIWNVPLAPEG